MAQSAPAPDNHIARKVITLLDTETVAMLTIDFLLAQPSWTSSVRNINEYVVRTSILDSNILRQANAIGDVSNHLSEIRKQMRAEKILGYDSTTKLWTLLPEFSDDYASGTAGSNAWVLLKNQNSVGGLLHALFKDNPTQFEIFCCNLLQDHCGCSNVTQSDKHKYSKNYEGDGGADGYGYWDGLRFAMEAKCYEPRRPIGESKSARLYQSMKRDGISHGFFITTSWFASNMKSFWDSIRDETQLKMIDGKGLLELMCYGEGYGAKRDEKGQILVNTGFILSKATEVSNP